MERVVIELLFFPKTTRNWNGCIKVSRRRIFTLLSISDDYFLLLIGGSDLLNREEYLLGRSIDKQFEQLDSEEKSQKDLPGVVVPKNHVEHECIPFSIRSYRNLQNNEQVDIQRKIMEDPLMQIRQKEMESRRRILENPVKLKELHRLLKQEEIVKKSKSSKKKKKSKKSHKKKRGRKDSSGVSSSSEDEDLDKLLAKKYRQIREEFGPNDGTFNLKKLLGKEGSNTSTSAARHIRGETNDAEESDQYSDDKGPDKPPRPISKHQLPSDEVSRYRKTGTYGKADDYSHRRSRARSRSYDEGRNPKTHKQKYNERRRNLSPDQAEKVHRNRNKSGSPRKMKSHEDYGKNNSPKRRHRESSSDGFSPLAAANELDEKCWKKNYGLVTASGEKIELKGTLSKIEPPQSSHKYSTERPKTVQQPVKSNQRERLTSEEKERRCREMMKNAEWRDTDRRKKVEKYREEYEREDVPKDFDQNFINKAMHRAMETQTSMESRLKSNINNIQRSGRAMESNFARR